MIIFGCITKYTPQDIRPYVESIEQSGFKGSKVMLVYDVPQETIDYLKSKGFTKIGSGCESVVYSKEGFEYVIKIVYDAFTYSGNKTPFDSIHFAKSKSFPTNSILLTVQEKVDEALGNIYFPKERIKAFVKPQGSTAFESPLKK